MAGNGTTRAAHEFRAAQKPGTSVEAQSVVLEDARAKLGIEKT
jgi:hypothetical protein